MNLATKASRWKITFCITRGPLLAIIIITDSIQRIKTF